MTDLPETPRQSEGLYGTEPTAPPVTPTGPTPYDTAGPLDTTTSVTTTDYSDSGSRSKTDVAKDEAGAVKDTAVSAGKDVAATAKSEAANVAQEAKYQAKGLLGDVTSELKDQGRNQQQKIATQVHSLAKELGGMASNSPESGPLTDLAHEGSRRVGEVAHWLENREPKDILEEVKSFGRRRPVAFLGLCFAAGIVAGRITRGAVAANTELDSPSGNGDRGRELTSQRTTYADLPPAPVQSYGTTSYAGQASTGPDYVRSGYETGAVDTGYVDPATTTDPTLPTQYGDAPTRSDFTR